MRGTCLAPSRLLAASCFCPAYQFVVAPHPDQFCKLNDVLVPVITIYLITSGGEAFPQIPNDAGVIYLVDAGELRFSSVFPSDPKQTKRTHMRLSGKSHSPLPYTSFANALMRLGSDSKPIHLMAYSTFSRAGSLHVCGLMLQRPALTSQIKKSVRSGRIRAGSRTKLKQHWYSSEDGNRTASISASVPPACSGN